MAITPLHLSGSTNGEPILVNTTSSPGAVVHTVSNVSGVDEIYLDVAAMGTDAVVSVEFDSTNVSPVTVVAGNGYYRIIPGYRMGNGGVVRVYADEDVLVQGWVNRLEP